MGLTLKDVIGMVGMLAWCGLAAGLNRALGRQRLPLTALVAGGASALLACFEFPGHPIRIALAGVVGALAIFLLYRWRADEHD